IANTHCWPLVNRRKVPESTRTRAGIPGWENHYRRQSKDKNLTWSRPSKSKKEPIPDPDRPCPADSTAAGSSLRLDPTTRCGADSLDSPGQRCLPPEADQGLRSSRHGEHACGLSRCGLTASDLAFGRYVCCPCGQPVLARG